jgi:hypothetical protein
MSGYEPADHILASRTEQELSFVSVFHWLDLKVAQLRLAASAFVGCRMAEEGANGHTFEEHHRGR